MSSRLTCVLAAVILAAPCMPAQTWTWTGGIVPIPENTSAGVCTFPASASITVPPGATVTDVNIALDLSHGFAGDVGIRIYHGSTMVILADTIPFDASPLGSTYVFDDEAAISFDDALLGALGATPVPGGPCRGDGLLSAFDGQPREGAWTIELCDYAPGFTGFLGGFIIDIDSAGAGGLTYVITQTEFPLPTPPGLTRVRMLVTGPGSFPPNFCLKVWTANLGNFPNGWFFGLDIGFLEVFNWYSVGWPFFSMVTSLGATAESDTYFDGVPTGIGLTLYTVAVELDNVTLVPVHWSAPTAFTLL